MMSSRFWRRLRRASTSAEACAMTGAALRDVTAPLAGTGFLVSVRDDFFAVVAGAFLAAALVDCFRAARDDFVEVCLPALAGLPCAFFMPSKSIHAAQLVNLR